MKKYQSTVAQKAERVAADPRVCGLNPAKDPMVCASKSQQLHMAINNHKVSGYYKPGSWGGSIHLRTSFWDGHSDWEAPPC